MRNKILSLLTGVALALLYSGGAPLVTPSPAAAQDRVQLQVFMLKLPTGRGKQTKHTPITVYIDTDNPKASRYVSAIAPRIINSVFSRLRKMKLRLDKDGLLDMGRITETLRPVVERGQARYRPRRRGAPANTESECRRCPIIHAHRVYRCRRR